MHKHVHNMHITCIYMNISYNAQVLEQAAQGNSGILILGGAEEYDNNTV